MKDNAPLPRVPDSAVEDVPLQIFEDEGKWHDYVFEKYVREENPELARKVNELRKTARDLKKKSPGKRSETGKKRKRKQD